jgi:hypothetical protein
VHPAVPGLRAGLVAHSCRLPLSSKHAWDFFHMRRSFLPLGFSSCPTLISYSSERCTKAADLEADAPNFLPVTIPRQL